MLKSYNSDKLINDTRILFSIYYLLNINSHNKSNIYNNYFIFPHIIKKKKTIAIYNIYIHYPNFELQKWWENFIYIIVVKRISDRSVY